MSGGGAATAVDAARWRAVDTGDGRPGVRLPAVLARRGGRVAGSDGRDGAGAGSTAGVGALRRVRSGWRVLTRGIKGDVLEATVQMGTARRDGGAWHDGQAAPV